MNEMEPKRGHGTIYIGAAAVSSLVILTAICLVLSNCATLGVTGIEQYHHCFNWNASDPECRLEFPCEVRQFLESISAFVNLTDFVLSYGTVFIIVIGLLLNSLSFYTIVSSGLVKSGSGIYLATLAICDCGNLITNFGVGVARGQIPKFNQLFMDWEWLCRAHGVFVDLFQLISAWIVVSFTVERCIAVWYPMLLRNTSRTRRARSVIFGLSTVLSMFSMSKLFLTGFESDSVFGYPPCHSRRYRWHGMQYVRVAFQTWIPTVMVFVFNILMFFKLQHASRIRKRMTTGHGRNLAQTKRPSFIHRPSPTSKMLIAVSLAYLILVFPLGIVQTVEVCYNAHRRAPLEWLLDGKDQVLKMEYVDWMSKKLLLKTIRSFCFGFYQINFAINFFLYFAAGLQFRLHLQHKVSTMCGGQCQCCYFHGAGAGVDNITREVSTPVCSGVGSRVTVLRPTMSSKVEGEEPKEETTDGNGDLGMQVKVNSVRVTYDKNVEQAGAVETETEMPPVNTVEMQSIPKMIVV